MVQAFFMPVYQVVYMHTELCVNFRFILHSFRIYFALKILSISLKPRRMFTFTCLQISQPELCAPIFNSDE